MKILYFIQIIVCISLLYGVYASHVVDTILSNAKPNINTIRPETKSIIEAKNKAKEKGCISVEDLDELILAVSEDEDMAAHKITIKNN